MHIPEDQYVKVGSVNTHYWVEGHGAPLVLIHGISGSAAGWLLCFERLSVSYRVYALDLPGHGETVLLPDASGSPDYMAGFVKDFMAALQIERAHILGHSMGGVVAIHLASACPERIGHLILANPGGMGKEIALIFRLLSIPVLGDWIAAREFSIDQKKYGQNMRTSALNVGFITDELVEILYRLERKPALLRAILKILRGGVNWAGQKESGYTATRRHLAGLRNPTLIVWGKQDDILPVEHADKAKELLPTARFEILNVCGHNPMFDQPELMTQFILGFLAGAQI